MPAIRFQRGQICAVVDQELYDFGVGAEFGGYPKRRTRVLAFANLIDRAARVNQKTHQFKIDVAAIIGNKCFVQRVEAVFVCRENGLGISLNYILHGSQIAGTGGGADIGVFGHGHFL